MIVHGSLGRGGDSLVGLERGIGGGHGIGCRGRRGSLGGRRAAMIRS